MTLHDLHKHNKTLKLWDSYKTSSEQLRIFKPQQDQQQQEEQTRTWASRHKLKWFSQKMFSKLLLSIKTTTSVTRRQSSSLHLLCHHKNLFSSFVLSTSLNDACLNPCFSYISYCSFIYVCKLPCFDTSWTMYVKWLNNLSGRRCLHIKIVRL